MASLRRVRALAAGQAPDQANNGGQAGAGNAGDKSLEAHAVRRSGTLRPPGITGHHLAVPAINRDRYLRSVLTGPHLARLTRPNGVLPRVHGVLPKVQRAIAAHGPWPPLARLDWQDSQ